MGGIDSMAGTEPSQQPPPPAPMTPAPPPSTSSCSAGPSPSSQGSETSFDCTHCGKSLRSRKNYSKHMFIHSGKTRLLLLHSDKVSGDQKTELNTIQIHQGGHLYFCRLFHLFLIVKPLLLYFVFVRECKYHLITLCIRQMQLKIVCQY